MAGTPNETYFEAFIERYLTSQPILTLDGRTTDRMEYHSASPDLYDKKLCIIPTELISFLKETQPKEFDKLVKNAGGEELAVRSIYSRLDSELKRGTLAVLNSQSGFEAGYGVKFRLVYYKPASTKNIEHCENYTKNRLAVVRQLKYSERNNNEIDMVLFVNGLPVVTMELKNLLTGQRHTNAIRQWIQERPVKDEKFLEFKRCLVHFAVGTEQVYMTTRLSGE